MHLKKYASLFFLHIYFFTIFASHFSGYSFQRVGNLFSRNECSRKCGVYEVNAELAQLVEQLMRNE